MPHVVQPVGELDHQHPDVPAHRDDHLADGVGLRRFAVLDLVDLGAAVHEQGDLVAEVAGQLGEACSRCPRPCRAAGTRTAWVSFMPSSARIVVTASGWVMTRRRSSAFGPGASLRGPVGPLDQLRSALGWLARMIRKSGSRAGVCGRVVPSRAIRCRIRTRGCSTLDAARDGSSTSARAPAGRSGCRGETAARVGRSAFLPALRPHSRARSVHLDFPHLGRCPF